ncbi:hypothetical protein D9M70_330360 [compost metagenome]
MIDHQGMAVAATGGGEQDRGVDQGVLADQVEQVLELAGVAAAIDRRGDDQQVGRLDVAQFVLDGFRQLLAPQRAAQRPGDVAQLDEVAVDLQVLAELGDQRLGQGQRARGARGAAGNGDDFEGGAHVRCSCNCCSVYRSWSNRRTNK